MTEGKTAIERRIEQFRQNLLDTSLRNRMINFRTQTNKGKPLERVVQVHGEDPVQLLRILVDEGRTMTFLGKPDPRPVKTAKDSFVDVNLAYDPETMARLQEEAEHELNRFLNSAEPIVDQNDLRLNTDDTRSALQKKLTKIWRDARVAVEEQGVNVLFLTLGCLEWRDPRSSEEVRRAPLIIVPVILQRTASGGFRLKWDGGDIGENLSIAALLKAQHGIALPPLPEELVVREYLGEVAQSIKRKPDWEVDSSFVALGFLSYAKYLMYRDLDQTAWPKDSRPSTHPLMDALLESGFPEEEPGILEDTFLDPLRPAAFSCDVYDSDGSQTLAILEAKSGRSMVIEGPPGTGKSQTITNLIAEYVSEGKKVLFVAEKMAALEVVYRRLKEAHLEDACLELHSNKANKRSFYSEIKHTVQVAPPRAAQAETDLARYEQNRAHLTAYARAINEPLQGRGISPRDAMGRLIQMGREVSPEGRHDFEGMSDWDQPAFEQRKEAAATLQEQIRRMGKPSDHPYFGCTLVHLLPQDKEDIARLLEAAGQAVETFHASANALAEALRVELPSLPADIERLGEYTRIVAHAPDVCGVLVRDADWEALDAGLRELIAAGRRLNQIRAELGQMAVPDILDQDVSELLNIFRLTPILGVALEGEARPDLFERLDEARGASESAKDAAGSLARSLGVKEPGRLWSIEPVAALAKRIGTAPPLDCIAVADSGWPDSVEPMREALDAARRHQQAHAQFDRELQPAAWGAETAADREILETHGAKFFRFFNKAYRAAMARTAPLFAIAEKNPLARARVLRGIEQAQEADRQLGRHLGRASALFGERWKGAASDTVDLESVLSWVVELHASVNSGKVAGEVLPILERGVDQAALGRQGEHLRGLAVNAAVRIDALRESAASQGIRAIEDGSGDASERVYEFLTTTLRSSRANVTRLFSGAEAGSQETLRRLELVTEGQRLRSRLRGADVEISAALGPLWQFEESNWTDSEKILNWVLALRRQVSEGEVHPGLLTFFAEDRPRLGLGEATAKTHEDRDRAQEAVKKVLVQAQLHDDPVRFTQEPIAAQRSRIAHWRERLNDLPALIRYNWLAAEARELGLNESVALAESWDGAAEHLTEAFERSWYTGLVREAIATRSPLARFDRADHEQVAQEFRNLDDLILKYNRARVALDHWRRVPRTSAGGAMGWLKAQFAKKVGHKPIRAAMEQAGDAVQAIKPVFLMSPLSIAMYLPANGPRFDVVIFDEASQVKPEDAFGGLLRAKQIIVVGDTKQMPPTSFFDKLTSEGSEDEEEEFEDQANTTQNLESVLGLMDRKIPEHSPSRRYLRWHYRSHHDALIATSNNLFYEDKLVVFPSPWRSGGATGLLLRHDPSTIYDRGGKRNNLAEARAIALAAQRHVREHPRLTLGIAALSKAQQEAIQDEIDRLRLEDPAFEAFDQSHGFEPLFVKNLENVQGDERDVIFISIGYGRDASGFVPANFGPINRDGGERRLNVLMTRARVRCEVFSNLKAADIRLAETSRKGVHCLRTFLAFADTGSLDVPTLAEHPSAPPLDVAVLDKLRSAGYDVEPRVGSVKYSVDMAVRHPEDPRRFVLGIECDGPMYASTQTSRDRDKLRRSILESRGWRMHRVWSVDWFHNEEAEFARLEEAIRSAIDRSTEDEEDRQAPQDAAALERDDNHVVQEEWAAYEQCVLNLQLHGAELHEVPISTLADWVCLVVEIESPVHKEEVIRRVREGAGKGRAGTRIQGVLEMAIDLAVRQKRLVRKGVFLTWATRPDPKLRSRAGCPASMKRIDYVAPEEIMLALREVISHSFGIDPAEAVNLAARRLGFDRLTAQMAEQIHPLIATMRRRKTIEVNNGLLKVAAGPEQT